jgi:hypothetical protein
MIFIPSGRAVPARGGTPKGSGARLGNVPDDPCKGSFTLIQGTPELAIAGARFVLKNQTAAAGGQTEMSDGCGRLALCACEENSPRSSGPCRLAGRVAVCLPRGSRNRLDSHDRDQALQGFAAVKRADRQGANVHAFVYRAA